MRKSCYGISHVPCDADAPALNGFGCECGYWKKGGGTDDTVPEKRDERLEWAVFQANAYYGPKSHVSVYDVVR